MELFLDNDIIIKLSSINYMDKIGSIFNVSQQSIYVLGTAKFYIKNSSKLKRNYPKDILEKALLDITDFPEIPLNYIDIKKFILLSNKNGLDSGEHQLFSLSPPISDYLISTGDKTAIKALAKISDIVVYLKNKIVCLEYILHKFATSNFDELLKEISLNFCFDTEVKYIFNQQNLTKEMAFEGLLSCYNKLRAESSFLLLEL